MSARLRGQNVVVRVSVDGEAQDGTFVKVKNFSVSERGDIVEESYIGEVADDLQYQHHGFDISFECDQEDSKGLDFLTKIVRQEEDESSHPTVTITVFYKFFNGAQQAEVYQNVFLRMSESSIGGRKEYVTASFEGKCKKREQFSL